MPTDAPSSPPSVPTVLSTDPPEKTFKDLSIEQRMEWLKTHALKGTPTVSLADCYRRGAHLTHVIKIIGKLVSVLGSKIKPGSSKAIEIFRNLVFAFNTGLKSLGTVIYNDCNYLLSYGKYNDGGIELTPVEIENFKMDGLEGKGNNFIWDAIVETLSLITNKIPALRRIRPGMMASFADIITAFIMIGRDFMNSIDGKEENHKAALNENGTAPPVKNNGILAEHGLLTTTPESFIGNTVNVEEWNPSAAIPPPDLPEIDPVPVLHYPGCDDRYI